MKSHPRYEVSDIALAQFAFCAKLHGTVTQFMNNTNSFCRCCSSLVRHYSEFLYKYPLVFLILTPIFLAFCVVFSFVPGVGPDLPDFSEPTEV